MPATGVSSRGRLELRPVLALLPPLAPGEPDGSSTGEGWTVDLGLNHHGAVAFNRMAHDLYHRSPPQDAVALVVDGVVQSAPAFQTDSFSGDVEITGGFNEAQARQLAVTLRSGALPVHLRRRRPSR